MEAIPTNGARIRELRRELGLSQSQLGRACGLPAPGIAISHVEANRRTLTLARTLRLARCLGVTVEDITTPPAPTAADGDQHEVPA